ncbi:MAG: SRPBCC domain-containing protein [Steroidobacteraceae bacterium]|jgi:uncharacterized protein YndB with AHSA1/START domain
MSKSKRSGTRGYAHLVELEAPVARVWRALTDPALMRIWYGGDAEIDARKGGLYRLGPAGAGGREAHIDIFDVNRRLRLIYMTGSNFPPSDSAIVDDFLLDMKAGESMTSLRLLGSGIPETEAWDQAYGRIRIAWERFLARIKVTLENPPRPKKAKAPAPPVDPPLRGLDY